MKLTELQRDPENRRTHTPRNIDLVVDALKHVGAARSIVIDENDIVLAGNGVLEAAGKAGIQTVRVVEADGSEVIAVRRSGLSAEQKRALALYDNRAGELAEWDVPQLSADVAAGFDLQPFFFPEELDRLGVTTPAFAPGDASEQGRLDQKRMLTCPECGHVFPLTP